MIPVYVHGVDEFSRATTVRLEIETDGTVRAKVIRP